MQWPDYAAYLVVVGGWGAAGCRRRTGPGSSRGTSEHVQGSTVFCEVGLGKWHLGEKGLLHSGVQEVNRASKQQGAIGARYRWVRFPMKLAWGCLRGPGRGCCFVGVWVQSGSGVNRARK
jgi:hypothetical protein